MELFRHSIDLIACCFRRWLYIVAKRGGLVVERVQNVAFWNYYMLIDTDCLGIIGMRWHSGEQFAEHSVAWWIAAFLDGSIDQLDKCNLVLSFIVFNSGLSWCIKMTFFESFGTPTQAGVGYNERECWIAFIYFILFNWLIDLFGSAAICHVVECLVNCSLLCRRVLMMFRRLVFVGV